MAAFILIFNFQFLILILRLRIQKEGMKYGFFELNKEVNNFLNKRCTNEKNSGV
jgi:hypothetical protein